MGLASRIDLYGNLNHLRGGTRNNDAILLVLDCGVDTERVSGLIVK